MSQTRNQHFISRVEQRLNALNPNATINNQRIYEFSIVDRDKHELRLMSDRGRVIGSTLSMLDLFSFDVDKDENTRANFEHAFGRYENLMRANTEHILSAHSSRSSDVVEEMFNLFVAKVVNFIRNPFSVAKILNTFGTVGGYHPTNPVIYETYVRTMTGRKPHQAHICRQLGITDEQYQTWLRLLFMLLTPIVDKDSNMLEAVMKSLFEAEGHAVLVHVHKYDEHACLLSDRGFSQPIDQKEHLVFDFNLCANAFIRFAFLDYKAVLGRDLPEQIRRGLRLGPKLVTVSYLTNDLVSLDVFHRRVIEQSYEKVYCSQPRAHSAIVLPSAASRSRTPSQDAEIDPNDIPF